MATDKPCVNCGGEVKRGERRRGLCKACYTRGRRAGWPDDGVPDPRKRVPPVPPAITPEVRARIIATTHGTYEDRLAQFRELDSGTPGSPYPNRYGYPELTDAEIAERMGVTRRSVWRYRAAERAAGRGWRKSGFTRQRALAPTTQNRSLRQARPSRRAR